MSRPQRSVPSTPLVLALAIALGLSGCAGGATTRGDAPPATMATDASTTATAADVDNPDALAAPDSGAAATGAIAADIQSGAPAPADAPDTAAATGTAPAAGDPAVADGRTQAELDYDALYGALYDPIADPTLPAPAQMPTSYDPWEPFNRRVHAFNNVVDRAIAKPLAQAYVAVVPRPVRLGVGNFFNNLGQPVSAVNALLQGKPAQAGQSVGRFLVNTTLGVAGIFDPATRFRIPNRSEDFGQTLGVWGWRNSRYVELPLFGPRTVRDTFGLVGDAPMSPIRQVDEDNVRYFLQGLQLVDTRVQLLPLDGLRAGATDEYALFRDGWTQRRNYQIFGDPKREDGEALPDYLLEDETNPTVPADAMPMVPGR
ncbi:MAG TPA: VacJ family lipoprotein [Luteimonas sp.]|nr:VacJ family lipoprotein [Luteimonas sp.]